MTSRYWIAVVVAAHVRRGVAGGFIQVCHGKQGALSRMKPGDGIVCYSPREGMQSGPPVQAFTALGRIQRGEMYQVEMAPLFYPYRRDVAWRSDAGAAAIRPLLPALSITAGRPSWGQVFRYGLISLPEADFQRIEAAMLVGQDWAASA